MKKRELIIIAVFTLATLIVSSLALLSLPTALLVIAGFVIAVVVIASPFHGLLIYSIMLYVRPQDFLPALEKLRVMLALAAWIIVSFLIHNVFRKEKLHFLNPRQNTLMFGLLFIVLFSSLINLELKETWEAFNEFLTSFLLFLVIVNTVDSFEKFKTLCWTLVFCTLILSINGIVQYTRGYDLIGNPTTPDGRIEWIGIFGDPNDLALLINSFLPFVLINVFEREIAKWKRLLLTLMGIAYIFAIYYTNSRGGFISLIGILVFFSYKKWGLLKGAMASFICIAAIMLIAPSRMGEINPYERSASGRVFAWIDGLVFLKKNPLFGIGFRNFTAVHGRAAHSAFVECLAELGLIGYFLWLAVIYTSFRDIITVEKHASSSTHMKYARIIQLSLVGFLGSAVFLSQAYSPVLIILMALAVSICNFSEPSIVRPRILSTGELLTMGGILGGSILAFKLLALIYI